jgi:hypothetical protein
LPSANSKTHASPGNGNLFVRIRYVIEVMQTFARRCRVQAGRLSCAEPDKA